MTKGNICNRVESLLLCVGEFHCGINKLGRKWTILVGLFVGNLEFLFPLKLQNFFRQLFFQFEIEEAYRVFESDVVLLLRQQTLQLFSQ